MLSANALTRDGDGIFDDENQSLPTPPCQFTCMDAVLTLMHEMGMSLSSHIGVVPVTKMACRAMQGSLGSVPPPFREPGMAISNHLE